MTPKNTLRLVGSGITAALLPALAIWIRWQPPAWDAQLLATLAEHRRPWLDLIFRSATWAGSLYVLAPLATALCYLLVRSGHKQHALQLGCGLISATSLAYLLKYIIDRPRPVIGTHLVDTPLDYAFPSNHAAQVTAFVLMLVLISRALRPRWGALAGTGGAVMIIMVGLSRLYLQVHYPTDVLAGVLTGLLAVQWCWSCRRDR